MLHIGDAASDDQHTPERGRTPPTQHQSNINVGNVERWASAVGGGLLILYGLKRGAPLWVLLGGSLLYRGISGNCKVYENTGINTA